MDQVKRALPYNKECVMALKSVFPIAMAVTIGLLSGCGGDRGEVVDRLTCSRAAHELGKRAEARAASAASAKYAVENELDYPSSEMMLIGEEVRKKFYPNGNGTRAQETLDIAEDYMDSGYCEDIYEEGTEFLQSELAKLRG